METIRTAQLEDSAAIAHVHVESWRTTYQEFVPLEHHPTYEQCLSLWQRVLSIPSRQGITLVAVNEQGQLVGFVSGGHRAEYNDLAYDVELTVIYLLEEAQGHGLGRRLVQTFVEHILRMGYHSMLLWVFAQNHVACHFYEALGGVRIKTEPYLVGGVAYEAIAYGWSDISVLASVN